MSNLQEYEARIAELRKRLIVEFYTGTEAKATRFLSCRVCGWSWRKGQPEAHEPSCPLVGTGTP